jgi:uncharacterized protein (TIGR00297 family)
MAHPFWTAAAVTVAFAALARLLRGVTSSGAIAGGVVCFALYAFAGPAAFAALVSVFVLTWSATRLGYSSKSRLGVAERREGRKASQVLANLAVAGVCALLYAVSHRVAFLMGVVAALSEAAADTVSSEIGQARGHAAHLITNWQQVRAGTDGGVSLAGTASGVVAALVVGSVCAVTHLLPWGQSLIAAAAGIAGMLADSYLGALFERRQKLSNDIVNLLSTAIAAGLAIILAG